MLNDPDWLRRWCLSASPIGDKLPLLPMATCPMCDFIQSSGFPAAGLYLKAVETTPRPCSLWTFPNTPKLSMCTTGRAVLTLIAQPSRKIVRETSGPVTIGIDWLRTATIPPRRVSDMHVPASALHYSFHTSWQRFYRGLAADIPFPRLATLHPLTVITIQWPLHHLLHPKFPQGRGSQGSRAFPQFERVGPGVQRLNEESPSSLSD